MAQSGINLEYNISFGGFVEPDPASGVPSTPSFRRQTAPQPPLNTEQVAVSTNVLRAVAAARANQAMAHVFACVSNWRDKESSRDITDIPRIEPFHMVSPSLTLSYPPATSIIYKDIDQPTDNEAVNVMQAQNTGLRYSNLR
jgi:hypothetical protein